MKALQFSVLFIALLSCSQVRAQTRIPEQIVMFVGDTRVIEADTTRVAIGNGSIVSVSSPAPGQLLFLGATPGVTTVNVWLQSGEQYRIAVNVTESDINAALATVNQLLEGTENITARLAGSRIVLEGDRVRDADQKRAESITESFGGMVMNFIGKLGWEQMIHFNVKIIEVRRTAVRQLGIRWDTTTAGPSVGIASSVDVRLNTVLNSQIEILEQKGDAYVIAEPTLSCRSGGTAHFVSGGELPIPVTDSLGTTTIEYKEFGVILDVKPVSDRTGTIYAQIDTEVSQVDDSVRVLGVPGFTKRKSVTEVNMREGETIAIAGLVDRSRQKDRQQVPGLGSLPLVGAAFRTTQTRNSETELLVLISPRIVTAQYRPGMLAADPNGDALRRAGEILSSKDAPPRTLAPLAPPAPPAQQPAPAPAPKPTPQSAPSRSPGIQQATAPSPGNSIQQAAAPAPSPGNNIQQVAAPSSSAPAPGNSILQAAAPELSNSSPAQQGSLVAVRHSGAPVPQNAGTAEELSKEEQRQLRIARRAAAEQRDLERRLRMLGPTAKVYLPATARR